MLMRSLFCVVALSSLMAFAEGEKNSRKMRLLVEELSERFKTYNVVNTFKPGQMVTWKPGMKNRKMPEEGTPAVVMQVLTEPITDELAESGSPYFREKLDVVLGIVDEDGDFLLFHFDSRRFEPVKPFDKSSL